MRVERYDALVVGSGPAGSVAALVLARGGARVALMDKAEFPRDKACGDLVGPRGVQTLAELGIEVDGLRLGDMEVTGPTGRTVVLPAQPGLTYPGYGVVIPRVRLDADLRNAAVSAGAVPITGRAGSPHLTPAGDLDGFEVRGDQGPVRCVGADVVIGADGALSRVGAVAGLVNPERVLWGFAVRAYLPARLSLPRIYLWEPTRWAGYPGYGWVFPGEDGQANAGLGVAARGSRRSAVRAVRDWPRFLADAVPDAAGVGPTLGGWLKLGVVGTVTASGHTLLVGDAAGLVNPLQGEGIAQALSSGRAAADAVLAAGPDGAAERYRADLCRYGAYLATTAPAMAWMIERPRAVAGVGRLLTTTGAGTWLAGGWALYWNDLLDGALPGWPRSVAGLAARAGRLVTAGTKDRQEVRQEFPLRTRPGRTARRCPAN